MFHPSDGNSQSPTQVAPYLKDYMRKFYDNKDACQFVDYPDMAKGPSIFGKNNAFDEDEDW